MISISRINFYLFFLTIISSYFFVVEITFLIAVVGVLVHFNFLSLKKEHIDRIKLPFYLVLIGLIFSYQNRFIDILRDLFYFVNPIIIFLFGYLSASRIPFNNFLKTFLILGGFLALYFVLGFNFELVNSSVNEIKKEEGIASYVTVISFSVLVILQIRKVHYFKVFMERLLLFLTGLASVLAFSRTFILVFGICLVFGLGFVKLNRVLPLRILAIALIVLTSFASITFLESSNKRGSFIGKLNSSLTEISVQDYRSESDINTNWRGYESFMGLKQISAGSLGEIILGQGFGALAPLGITIKLGGKEFTEIPIFHNGYITIILKTGFLGLFIYILFLGRILISNVKRSSTNFKKNLAINLSAAFAIILFLTTFIISGWLNQTVMVPIILCFGYFLNIQNYFVPSK